MMFLIYIIYESIDLDRTSSFLFMSVLDNAEYCVSNSTFLLNFASFYFDFCCNLALVLKKKRMGMEIQIQAQDREQLMFHWVAILGLSDLVYRNPFPFSGIASYGYNPSVQL